MEGRLERSAEESPPTEEKPKVGENQEEQESNDGTLEDPTALASFEDDRRGESKGGGATADVDRGATHQEETGDENEYSEWRVHPRVTPRKDIALQVSVRYFFRGFLMQNITT